VKNVHVNYVCVRAHLYFFRMYTRLSGSKRVNWVHYSLAKLWTGLNFYIIEHRTSSKTRIHSNKYFCGSSKYIRHLIDVPRFQHLENLTRKCLELWPQQTDQKHLTTKNVLVVTPRQFKIEEPHAYYSHEIFSCKLRNVMYNGQIFYTEDHFVNQDLWSDPKLDSSYGLLNPVFAGYETSDLIVGDFKSPKHEFTNATYVNIFGRYLNNYWHFLCEYIPKLQQVGADEVLIIPHHLCDSFKYFLFSLLEKLSISFVLVPKNGAKFSEIKFIKSPVMRLADGTYSFDLVAFQWSRKLIMETLNLSSDNCTELGEEVYFLTRRSPRRIVIDRLLRSRMAASDFIICNPARISIRQQIEIFMTAKAVIGYPGANWANLMFAREKLLVFNLVVPGNARNSLHQTIGIMSESEVIEVFAGPFTDDFEKQVDYTFIDKEGMKISAETADRITDAISVELHRASR
jgi:Glycosyltransferase 61